MAAGVTDRLIDGFAKIDNIRVVAPPKDAATPAQAAFVVTGELQSGDASLDLAGAHDPHRRPVKSSRDIGLGRRSIPIRSSSNRGSRRASVISWRGASTR